jgi:integrase/recombinase XerD
MKKEYPLIPLFKKFIKETENGQHLKKNDDQLFWSCYGNLNLNNLIKKISEVLKIINYRYLNSNQIRSS